MADIKKLVAEKIQNDLRENNTDSLYDLLVYIEYSDLLKFIPKDLWHKFSKGFCCDACQESVFPWDVFRGVEGKDLCVTCLFEVKTPTDLRLGKLLNDDSDGDETKG
jgi:hypothetical protein